MHWTSPRFRPWALIAALASGGLPGCVGSGHAPTSSPSPQGRPVPAAVVVPPLAAATPASEAARLHYAQVQAVLLSQGLLRTDGGGPDTPYTDRMLAENFVRIALYDEYSRAGGAFVRKETTSTLRRWQVPVRVGLRFGASVPPDKQATDRARIASYLARLASVTGHPIAMSDSPNFWIYVVSEDERLALAPQVGAAMPGLSPSDIRGITDMPQSTYCLVYAMTEGGRPDYTRAFAVIRAEHPDLLRLSCVHEEVAQGLGLANDSPRARPSIFNDDEEFALLTTMDEQLLRILYSPELRPGMTEAEATPIVKSLASRLTGGES